MSDKPPQELSFEEALNELESLVEHMENDQISLEESLQSFERGIQLTRTCQEALQAAEQRVQILTKETQQESLEPFDGE
ncbi:MAG: exodeoxyribonuclease VII small subunit [bacterium]